MTVCTRFAPSPTGFLHVGSARTALYSWAYAKKQKGTFILRIEDTDIARSTQEAVDVILEGMQWLGLHWDTGPFYQTQRFPRYAAVVEQLLAQGHAYKCYCSKERLESLREEQIQNKQKARYDGHCRDKKLNPELSPNTSFVVRFKNPTSGFVEFTDAVMGHITTQNTEMDDLIIVRSDGTPTYNFTVVVDDWEMQVTHVIRGSDHLTNTPRQINILKALGATPPIYAHLPMILGTDGKKLSKRHGAVSVLQYREEGFLPEALLNYLIRLGWSHGDQEIFSTDEIIEYFDISALNKAPAAFDTNKLLWLNHHYMKALPLEKLTELLQVYMQKLGLNLATGPKLIEVAQVLLERSKTLLEMAEKSRYFYEECNIENESGAKHLTPEAKPLLQAFKTALELIPIWHKEAVHEALLSTSTTANTKLGQLAQPVRVAVTGGVNSPSIDITIALIGRERVVARIEKALQWIASKNS